MGNNSIIKPRTVRHEARDEIFPAPSPFFGGGAWYEAIRPRSRGRMPSLVGRGSPICERFSRMRLPVIAHANIILYTGIFYHVYSGTSINCIVKIVMHYMSVYTGIELPRVRHHDKITTVGVILHNTLRVMLKKVAQLHTHFENHLQ